MFEPCDTDALKANQWRCNIGIDKIPTGYEREHCIKYLTKASEEIGDDDRDKFAGIKQIELDLKIKKAGGTKIERVTRRCYKDELFTINGWCKIKHPKKGKMDWGFCDTSCQHATVIILFTVNKYVIETIITI